MSAVAWCVLPASQPHLSCRGLLLATTTIFACYSNMCDPCGLLREAVKVHVWKGVIFFPCSALRLSVVHQLMSVWPAGAVSDPQSSETRKLGRWVAACLRWFKSREAAVDYFNHKVISSDFRPGVKFPNWKKHLLWFFGNVHLHKKVSLYDTLWQNLQVDCCAFVPAAICFCLIAVVNPVCEVFSSPHPLHSLL